MTHAATEFFPPECSSLLNLGHCSCLLCRVRNVSKALGFASQVIQESIAKEVTAEGSRLAAASR